MHAAIPFPITNPAKVRLHRIVVALNAAERCRRAIGGSGSLILMPHLVGTAHIDPTDTNFTPFAIGQINPSRDSVHDVLDDITLDTVVRELDTVSDFIKYLRKKRSPNYSRQAIRGARRGRPAGCLFNTNG